jgi:hypothetical protein
MRMGRPPWALPGGGMPMRAPHGAMPLGTVSFELPRALSDALGGSRERRAAHAAALPAEAPLTGAAAARSRPRLWGSLHLNG